MKTITKKITPQREAIALSDSKKSGFPIAFGDKSLFNTLCIEVYIESCNETRVFKIGKEFLPNNKTNTTRFYLKEGGVIRWCSKVAGNMMEEENCIFVSIKNLLMI